jgi:hypothetical protein
MSASIFTTIYVAAFRPEAMSFLLFIAVSPAVLGLLAMPFLDAPVGEQIVSQERAGAGLIFPETNWVSSDSVYILPGHSVCALPSLGALLCCNQKQMH